MVERGGPAGQIVSPPDVLPLLGDRREGQPWPGLDVLQDLLVVVMVAGQSQVGVL